MCQEEVGPTLENVNDSRALFPSTRFPLYSATNADVKSIKVYILRSQGTLSNRMALSITYLPADPSQNRGSKTFALFLGCPAENAEHAFKELESSSKTVFSPFTLMKIFLEKERANRLNEIDNSLVRLQNMTERFVSMDSDDTYPHSPKQMIKLYHNIYHLKNGLVAWKTQVERMLLSCDEFRSMPGGEVDIDPEVYLQRLIDDYETRIHDCEALLEGGSFAFQIVRTTLFNLAPPPQKKKERKPGTLTRRVAHPKDNFQLK